LKRDTLHLYRQGLLQENKTVDNTTFKTIPLLLVTTEAIGHREQKKGRPERDTVIGKIV